MFHPIYVAIPLRRDDQTLLNYINIWLDQIELDGTLGKIRTSGWATPDNERAVRRRTSTNGPETPTAYATNHRREEIRCESCCSACWRSSPLPPTPTTRRSSKDRRQLKLVSVVYEDQESKTRTPVYGEHPRGRQIATADGIWLALVTAEGAGSFRRPMKTAHRRCAP